jgi:hypothetical protein
MAGRGDPVRVGQEFVLYSVSRGEYVRTPFARYGDYGPFALPHFYGPNAKVDAAIFRCLEMNRYTRGPNQERFNMTNDSEVVWKNNRFLYRFDCTNVPENSISYQKNREVRLGSNQRFLGSANGCWFIYCYPDETTEPWTIHQRTIGDPDGRVPGELMFGDRVCITNAYFTSYSLFADQFEQDTRITDRALKFEKTPRVLDDRYLFEIRRTAVQVRVSVRSSMHILFICWRAH